MRTSRKCAQTCVFVRFRAVSLETECDGPVNQGALRIVETVAAIVACAVALVLGRIAGLRVPIGHPWIILAGVVVGEVCAAVYLGLANWAGRVWHGLLDPRLVGVHFMALIVAAGLCGAIGAWFGYRKAMGRGLF
jgi:hypothetical protein